MAAKAEATRARILEVAWTLMTERGVGNVTLSDVAAAVGISRQALHLNVGSRAGLLVAMTRARDEYLGLPDRLRTFVRSEPPPAEHLRLVLDAWIDHIPSLEPVASALEAAARSGDQDAATAWQDRMDDLRAAIARPVRRLAAAHQLGARWSVKTATDWVWAQTHIATWHHLIQERGWSQTRTKDTMLATILPPILSSAAGP